MGIKKAVAENVTRYKEVFKCRCKLKASGSVNKKGDE